jgi:outer membrane protein TolC
MSIPTFVFLLMTGFGPAFARADVPPPALELAGVLAAVRSQDPVLASAHAEASAAKARSTSDFAWDAPQLALQVAGAGTLGGGAMDPGQRDWTITQNLPFPGRTLARGRASSLRAEASGADADAMEASELRDATVAFYRLVSSLYLSRGLDTVSQATHEMARLSKQRAGFGQLDRMGQFMDAMLAMEDSGVESLRPTVRQQKEDAQAALRRLMGGDPLTPLGDPSVAIPDLIAQEPPSLEWVLKRIDERSPQLRRARLSAAAAGAEAAFARSAWLPDLMVQGSLTTDPGGGRQEAGALGLSVPYVWFWKQAGEARAAGLEAAKAKQDLESLRLALRERAEEALGGLHSVTEALRIQWTLTYPQAATGLELARSGFRTTALGPSEILMAVQDYRSTNEALAGLIAQWGEAKADLDQLTAEPSFDGGKP